MYSLRSSKRLSSDLIPAPHPGKLLILSRDRKRDMPLIKEKEEHKKEKGFAAKMKVPPISSDNPKVEGAKGSA
jgi:hypothetical protein